MEIRITMAGGDAAADLESLQDWLYLQAGLAGLVKRVPARPQPGEMGAAAEALVVAVSSGGAVSVLATALSNWFSQPRRSHVRVHVETQDQRIVDLDADRVRADEVEAMLRQALDPPSPQE